MIREVKPNDLQYLKTLYEAAFLDEDLTPLLFALHEKTTDIQSFLYAKNEIILGHIAFTKCRLGKQKRLVALLGPLCVMPKNQNIEKVLVLGDPLYYGRLGFLKEDYIKPPYSIPSK